MYMCACLRAALLLLLLLQRSSACCLLTDALPAPTAPTLLPLQGWCFAYTCQKRLSTFWTILPSGHTAYVSFTGTPSQVFRLWWPYADADSELVLVINYLYTPNRRFVWLGDGQGPVVGRLAPEDKPPTIGDGKGHGSYFWDQDNTLMYVKVKGGKSLEIRTEFAVMVSDEQPGGRPAKPKEGAAAGVGCCPQAGRVRAAGPL